MNALLPLFATPAAGADAKAANLLAAARALTPHLNRSRTLDHKLVSGVMTTTFGASDAEGAWLWKDAYDAIEAALVLQLRRLAPQIGRLEDAPADIVALLANLSALSLTHTRRSEEQVAMDQFSTPPELGALAVLAAQVRPGDRVLEPSAGTGLLAILAEACGGDLTLRKGFFLGDGTGCGKGREIASVVADNLAQGRARAIWLSKNDALLEDARRDWTAIGGGASDITPQSAWKQADAIRMDKGILYTTYATLRQPARGDRPSRLDQIVTWLGADFDGVIVFDEAHAMANAGGGGKGARGPKKASQQGMAGLALQSRLGGVARVLGAPEPDLARVIGAPAARQLGLLHALLLRALEHPLRQRPVLTSSEAVRTYLRARLAAFPSAEGVRCGGGRSPAINPANLGRVAPG